MGQPQHEVVSRNGDEGYRESGIGRQHGVEGPDDFLESKRIYLEPGTESYH